MKTKTRRAGHALLGVLLCAGACSRPAQQPPAVEATSDSVSASAPQVPTRRLLVRVFYRGRAPVAVPVPASDCPAGDASVADNPFSRTTDFALGGVAVWVSNPGSNRPVSREPTVIRLRHCRFEPSRLAVAAGSRLRFVNEDPLVHSLVSTAESNPKLDAGLPFPGMSADLVLPAAELGVRVASRRFPAMTATVAVVRRDGFIGEPRYRAAERESSTLQRASQPSRSASRNAAPYRSSLTGPTPGTSSSSWSLLGRRSAMPRSAASLKTM